MLAGIWLPNHTAPYACDTSPERLCPPRTPRSIAISQVAGIAVAGGSEGRPRDSSPRNYGLEASSENVFHLRFPTFSGRAEAGAELGTELSDAVGSFAADVPTSRALIVSRAQELARGKAKHSRKQAEM